MKTRQEVRERAPRGARRNAEQWRSLVRSHERSGMTQAAFCAQEGISVMSLSNWRKRLGDGAVTVERSEPAFIDIGSVMSTPASTITLRLDLGGGLVLTVTRG